MAIEGSASAKGIVLEAGGLLSALVDEVLMSGETDVLVFELEMTSVVPDAGEELAGGGFAEEYAAFTLELLINRP